MAHIGNVQFDANYSDSDAQGIARDLSLPHPIRMKLLSEHTYALGEFEHVRPGQIIVQRLGYVPENGAENFYTCRTCGQIVDERDLKDVLHHERPNHAALLRN